MGQLSDAIREHLELKRQHGAAEEEISHQEAEALGPVRREPEAVAPAAEGDRSSSAFDAETALIGSEEVHEEPIKPEEPEPLGYESLEEEPADYRAERREEEPADYRAERRDPEPLEEPEPFGYAEGDEPEVGHEPGVGESAEGALGRRCRERVPGARPHGPRRAHERRGSAADRPTASRRRGARGPRRAAG
ncbi:MAG: hypothetical protein WKF31_08560 [Thermoleophilaceae bacterium]